jgi:hypothetical protein
MKVSFKKGNVMQFKHLLTVATVWIVIVSAAGNLCLGQVYWKKTFNEEGFEKFYTIQPTTDGNFLVVGSDMLIKIKPNGDTLWTKTFDRGEFCAIQPTIDSNFLVVDSNALIKIKPNGETIWTKTYGNGKFYAIQPTTDNNFLIAGSLKGDTNINMGVDGWLVKIKPNGDTIWTKSYGKTGDDEFFEIQPTIDGNFLIAGYKISLGGFDGWLVKIKPDGDTMWTKTYGGAGYCFFKTIQPTIDGNFLIAGSKEVSEDMKYGWLIKVKPDGDTIWTKTYSGTGGWDEFSSIQLTSDRNFLIAGSTASYVPVDTRKDGWLVKIKPEGNIIWSKTFLGTGWDAISTVRATTDGNFLVAGPKGDGGSWLTCIIADQNAYKNALFIYKIPTYGEDTLNFGYTPIHAPSGMSVSLGGTISWTPKTDSVYMDHAEFLVFTDAGKKDTLTFNIFVNSDYHAPASIKPSRINKSISNSFEINTISLSGKIKFSMPLSATSMSVYDINGRIIDKVTQITTSFEAYAIWPSASSGYAKITTGKYFAKVNMGNNTIVKPFLLVR